MKLKWKIFLLSLAFIMIAVSATALTLIHTSFASAVSAERENAAAYHSYFSSSAANRLMYARLTGSLAVLDEEKTESSLSAIALEYESFGNAKALIILNEGKKEIGIGGNDALIDRESLPSLSQLEGGKCSTSIYDTDSLTVLSALSSFRMEGDTYYLYTAHDVTETFSEYESFSRLAGAVSIGFALIIAIILFAFTAIILRPLSRLNSSIDRIAKGDYGARAEEHGSTETKEMAKNINIMAASVEDNVKRLEGIAESRKRYTDSLAHEMKTPLTSILGYADLLRLKRNVSDSERLEAAGVIFDEAKRLRKLSSKLLELALADSTQLELERVFVSSLIDDIVQITAPVLAKKQVSLHTHYEKCSILADRELFKSLLLNLIDNAAKASPEGAVIELYCTVSEGNARFTVRDYGIGMSPEILEKVTEPFFMADKARSRKAGGAGLGLSLCAQIAKRHGATLHIESKLSEGTIVTVTLPLAKGDADDEEQ